MEKTQADLGDYKAVQIFTGQFGSKEREKQRCNQSKLGQTHWETIIKFRIDSAGLVGLLLLQKKKKSVLHTLTWTVLLNCVISKRSNIGNAELPLGKLMDPSRLHQLSASAM